MSISEHETMVQDCEDRESELSDWERLFIDSISSQLSAGRVLTPRQSERLDEIWERIT